MKAENTPIRRSQYRSRPNKGKPGICKSPQAALMHLSSLGPVDGHGKLSLGFQTAAC